MQRIDILILFFSPTGRDTEAMVPLMWCLEHQYGYKVKYGSIFDAVYLLWFYQPKVLLLNNVIGSEFNVLAANYAYNHGIIVISLVSEGLFTKRYINENIWGNNKKNVNWDKLFIWSDKFLEMAAKHLPKYRKTLDISGSTGIDRCKIYKFLTKKQFLQKYRKENFKKVILYIGYNFGLYFDDKWIGTYNISKKEIEYARGDFLITKNILHDLIVNNKDILFILKKHPGELRLDMDVDYSWQFDNLIILDDQESLGDLINAGDLCIVYESTVTFEAYALNKTVINIMPSKNEGFRHQAYKGNVLAHNYYEIVEFINEYFDEGEVKSFTEKANIRGGLIKENIGNSDGFNSYRTAQKINNFLQNDNRFTSPQNKRYYTSDATLLRGFIIHFVLRYNWILRLLPKFRNSLILKRYNTFNLIYVLINKYYPQIKKYYG